MAEIQDDTSKRAEIEKKDMEVEQQQQPSTNVAADQPEDHSPSSPPPLAIPLTTNESALLPVEKEIPIEDLRKLYTSSSNMSNAPVTKQEDTDTSNDSSTDEDSGIQRLMIAEHPPRNENGDEEDIGDSSLSFYWQKTINIGDQYQAVVPDLLPSAEIPESDFSDDQLLWSPPVDDNPDENSSTVYKYLKSAAKEHRTADQELVLEVLLSTEYDADQALEKLRLPSTNKNYVYSAPWTLPECDLFEQCFKDYGKDFSMFKIPNRTVKELIFFYYIWKKSARHDVFVRQNRVEKRRFHMHPYVTDYLEKFFVEQEMQLMQAYEQNNVSLLPSNLNPQMSGDQLLSKRRLSSELFLKPNSNVKRTKATVSNTDQELIKQQPLDLTDLSESSPIVHASTPLLTKMPSDENKANPIVD